MPTRTMLEHYLEEVVRTTRYTPTEDGVHAEISGFPDLYGDGQDAQQAHAQLLLRVFAWMTQHLVTAQRLPTFNGVDLSSELGLRMLEVEFGVVAPDPEQAWYWTPEWQAGERQADEDIAAGRLEVFNSADDFLAAFD